MITRKDLTAVILAGGKAQKAGGATHSQSEVEGRVVIERQAKLLKEKTSRIELSVSSKVTWSRFPQVIDSHDPVGPLAGIAEALDQAATDYILVVHGGYAWIQEAALDLLVARAGEPFDACAIRIEYATPKPLFAIYHKRVAARAIARLERGEHDAEGLLTSEGLAVRWIEDYEFQAVDPDMKTYKVVALEGAEPAVAEAAPEVITAPAAVATAPVAVAPVAVLAALPPISADGGVFPFQSLEAYQRAVVFLPTATALAKLTDAILGEQLVRSALAINLGIAVGTADGKHAARSSALSCAAVLDAMRAVGVGDSRIAEGHALLARIVSLLA